MSADVAGQLHLSSEYRSKIAASERLITPNRL